MLLNKVVEQIEEQDIIRGYLIEDAGSKYYIAKEELLARDIFNLLINEGYKYINALTFIDPFLNASITTLPSIELSSLSASEKLDIEIKSLPEDIMTQAELVSFMETDTLEYSLDIKYQNDPIEILFHDREEIIDFFSKHREFNKDDPRTFVPLNMLTERKNLVPLNTFIKGDDTSPNNIINYYSQYGLSRYIALLEYLESKGVLENRQYAAIEILAELHKWGIPGTWTATNSYNSRMSVLDPSTKVKNNISKMVVYEAGGIPVDKSIVLASNSRFNSSAISQEDTLKVISSLVIPELPVIEYVTQHGRQIAILGATVSLSRHKDLSLYAIKLINTTSLPYELYDVRFTKSQVVDQLKLYTAAGTFRHMLRIPVGTASTFKAYTTTGLDIVNIVNYVIGEQMVRTYEKPEALSEDNEEAIKENQLYLKEVHPFIKEYFRDEMDVDAFASTAYKEEEYGEFEPSSAYEQMRDLVSAFISGETKEDKLAAGYMQDKDVNIESTYLTLAALTYQAGFTVADIMRGLSTSNFTAPHTSITNSEGKEALIANRVVESAAVGYMEDCSHYRARRIKDSLSWLWIRSIFSSPAESIETTTHVAVKALMLNHKYPSVVAVKNKYFDSIRDMLLVKYSLLEITPYINRIATQMTAQLLLATLNQYYDEGKPTLQTMAIANTMSARKALPMLGQFPQIKLDPQDIIELNKHSKLISVSTAQLLRWSYDDIAPQLMTINAIVTPDYVIPRTNAAITVYPINIYARKWSVDSVEALRKRDLISGYYSGSILEEFKNGTQEFLSSTEAAERPADAGSLLWYTKQLIDTEAEIKDGVKYFTEPPQPYDAINPRVAKDFPQLRQHPERRTWEGKFPSVPVHDITGEYCLKTYSYVRWLLENPNTKNLGYKSTLVTSDVVITYEEILNLGDNLYEVLIDRKIDRINMLACRNNMVYFVNGESVPLGELSKLDSAEYAIDRLSATTFLITSASYRREGTLCKIDINAEDV